MIRGFSLAIALVSVLALIPARAHTRDEVRAAYAAVAGNDSSPYAEAPEVRSPYAAGALTEQSRNEALGFLNFARWLAGLSPVTDSQIYDYQCQHGAVLLAALDYVDHNAPRPADMDRNFYDSAHIATTSGCIARFNWMRDSILREGVEYFLRDDGEANLAELGHRRWALNPLMAATGFGLANAKSGMSYVTMYAHDLGNPAAEWDSVPWPAPGAFPAELIHDHLPWSVTLNPAVYDLESAHIEVELTEADSGLSFVFRPADGVGDGFCCLNTEGYGAGPCLIFRPDFTGVDFTDYQQNQRWTVRVTGLKDREGRERPMSYEVRLISLTPLDAVNVEISPLEAALFPGESITLTADVVPAWADDVSVRWRSTDESVATVDAAGKATAVGIGECEIVAATANGCEDRCHITVHEENAP